MYQIQIPLQAEFLSQTKTQSFILTRFEKGLFCLFGFSLPYFENEILNILPVVAYIKYTKKYNKFKFFLFKLCFLMLYL